MKRIESSNKTIASPPIDREQLARHLARFRRREFENRIMPLQYLVWMGIALSVGIGIAALGVGHIPKQDIAHTLSEHFVATDVSYARLFCRLLLSLIPSCLLLIGAALTYFNRAIALLVIGIESGLHGVCLYTMCRAGCPLPWMALYTVWVVGRLGTLFAIALTSGRVLRRRHHPSGDADPKGPQTWRSLTHDATVYLTEFLSGLALCAAVAGLYRLIS